MGAADGQRDRYAVVGNPVSHSLSPRIHAQFAVQTGQSLSYEAIELSPRHFAEELHGLQRQGYRGVNVTVPFKREAWELSDHLSERAADAGACNTLSFEADGSIAGDNTDGVGLVRDLTRNLGIDIDQRHILVLGAGGAVRGVLGPLLALSPRRLVVANRTPARASALAKDFCRKGAIEVQSFAALGNERFDLVINGTAAGLQGEVPPIPAAVLERGSLCYDMMYDIDADTAFIAWAKRQGATASRDGLGMLVEQAAAAFAVWRGVEVDSAQVIQSLRAG